MIIGLLVLETDTHWHFLIFRFFQESIENVEYWSVETGTHWHFRIFRFFSREYRKCLIYLLYLLCTKAILTSSFRPLNSTSYLDRDIMSKKNHFEGRARQVFNRQNMKIFIWNLAKTVKKYLKKNGEACPRKVWLGPQITNVWYLGPALSVFDGDVF